MPGFLGGSGASGSGTGGEIRFPKEFVDPVTKLRVSNPENLIDTDFEYGLQPTKWETVELINNTPSFFSKSGDTTIPGIISISTNAGTREITVITGLDHGLAIGIPINVQGTKSVTADGSYIINSIPDTKTFTYLAKSVQSDTLAIEDLYTSIVTGEFFQGSQLRIADADGITTDAESTSTLTVTTESPHGFGPNTPFYFLNLNSTISQEFEAANTAAKAFDASNSATAQTFDGSNTLSTINIDLSNSATVGGTISNITSVNTVTNTISVAHTNENFFGLPLGTPLYYDVQATLGYFFDNPRGVVFLNSVSNLDVNASTFTVSALPDGDDINLQSNLNGTFQIANQARTFAGNNVNSATETVINVVRDAAIQFEGANDEALGGNGTCTVTSYSGSLINVGTNAGAGLDYYQGAMVLYSTSGGAASGLTNNTTYFIDSFFSTGTDTYAFTIKEFPNDQNPITVSGGTGTQTFKRIGVSVDKDIIHIKNSFFSEKDMLEYSFPAGGAFEADFEKSFYFVATAYDQHNYELSEVVEANIEATGGSVIQTVTYEERNYTVHRFISEGTFTFSVTDAGTFGQSIKYVVSNGSFDGDAGVLVEDSFTAATGDYTVVVNSGGRVDIAYPEDDGTNDIPFNVISPIQIAATGGSIEDTTIGGREYRIHRFTNVGSDTFTVTRLSNFGNDVEYLVVGGGGGSGGIGGAGGSGGGGGGAVIEGTQAVTTTSYPVVVAAGGVADNLTVGGTSSVFSVSAPGGGSGGGIGQPGADGSSGGGAGGTTSTNPDTYPISGLGTAGLGFDGGTGNRSTVSANAEGERSGGGGGGAGGPGQSVPTPGSAGDGGIGKPSSITGTQTYYGGGGGGGAAAGTSFIRNGLGGLGGGANGRTSNIDGVPGFPGTPNTGGGGGGVGGGGTSTQGGAGGSGIVIIRYPLEPATGGN
jgi:hypothetical protein